MDEDIKPEKTAPFVIIIRKRVPNIINNTKERAQQGRYDGSISETCCTGKLQKCCISYTSEFEEMQASPIYVKMNAKIILFTRRNLVKITEAALH